MTENENKIIKEFYELLKTNTEIQKYLMKNDIIIASENKKFNK